MKKALVTATLLLTGNFVHYASGEAPSERTEVEKQTLVTTDILDPLAAEVHQGRSFEEATQAGIQSTDPDIQFSALNLFCTLVRQGQAFQEAIAAAQVGIQHPNSGELNQDLGYHLFSELIQQGQGFIEAIIAAQIGMKNKDILVQSYALELFNNLVTQGQGLREIIANAQFVLLTLQMRYATKPNVFQL